MTDASQYPPHVNSRDSRAYGAPAGDALDPWTQPELYAGVLTRRTLAFLIDVVIITTPIVLSWLFIGVFGLFTFGLGWHLFWLITPVSAIWPVFYYGISLGGPHAATPGMRIMGVQMLMLHGGRGTFMLGAAHALLFWASVSFLTPAVVLVALFNRRRRLLHDVILGTAVVNAVALWR